MVDTGPITKNEMAAMTTANKDNLERVSALCHYAMQASGIATALLVQRRQDEIVIREALRQAEAAQKAAAAALTHIATSDPTLPSRDGQSRSTSNRTEEEVAALQDSQQFLYLLEETQEVIAHVQKTKRRTLAAQISVPTEEDNDTEIARTLSGIATRIRQEPTEKSRAASSSLR